VSKKQIIITAAVACLIIISASTAIHKTKAQAVPTINVKDAPYSAKGDGVTDDTAAIQAAVNAAYTAGGGSTGAGAKVYFPDGKYIVTSVSIKDNVTYEGQSKENTIIQRPEASIVGGEPVAITRENPAKMTTASAHELNNGDVVYFSGITQSDWDSLNDKTFTVRKIDNSKVLLFYNGPMDLAPDIYAMAKGAQTQISSMRVHGLQTGDRITLFDITQAGWTALNGNSYPITKMDNYKFTIDFDSTSLADYNDATDYGKQYRNLDATSFSADYDSTDPGLARKQSKWIRTFTNGPGYYSSDSDSKPLVIQNLTFDGNSQKWGPYKNYEQEQAGLLFLAADSSKNGRLKARVENCYFRNGVSDGISAHTGMDIDVENVTAENVFRGGFVSTGDNSANNRIRIKNLTTKGNIDPTGIDVEGYGDTDGTKPSEIYMENINIEDGDFDVAVESGTKVTGKNIVAHSPTLLWGGDATFNFSDSTFYFGAGSHIYRPGNMTFDNCNLYLSETDSTEADRNLMIFVHWYNGINQKLTFNDCSFDVDSSVEESDKTFALSSTMSTLEDGNNIYFNNSYISNKFDVGMDAGSITGQRGAKWKIKNSYIGAKVPIQAVGFTDTTYGNNYFNILLDGDVFQQGYGYIVNNSSSSQNTLENERMQIDEAANKIYSYYGLEGNIYSGSRLILGDNSPTASTNCLAGDIYRLKNPVSGQVHEWKCADSGYQKVNNSFVVTSANSSSWQAQPILPAIASLSNLPDSLTTSQSTNMNVGGTNIISYKYKLDDGSWSAEQSISNPIDLNSLANGSHTVSVIGKKSSDEWQPEDRAITETWLILNGIGNTPTYTIADINEDSKVDSADLDILKTDFLKLTANLTNSRSDINLDGQCTARDLGILMSGWK
jgi:hypothetical protein